MLQKFLMDEIVNCGVNFCIMPAVHNGHLYEMHNQRNELRLREKLQRITRLPVLQDRYLGL